MSSKICFLIFLILCTLWVKAQFKTETNFVTFEGYERSYEVFVPENYTEIQNYPLVFVIHGGGGTGKGLVRTTRAQFNKLATRDKFIVVYPNGIEKSWNDGARDTIGVARKLNINDVGYFEKMIVILNYKYSIDNKNIFACGISNGGFMSQRLAFELSHKIKGIGVVAANLSVVQSSKELPINSVSVIFINGTNDPLVPYNGGDVSVFRKKRGKVLSVEESIETWKKINNCSEFVAEFPYPDKNLKDNCTAVKTIWQHPKNPKTKVAAIKIENGGHTWPDTKQYLPKKLIGNTNRDFNGCEEIWTFFKSLM